MKSIVFILLAYALISAKTVVSGVISQNEWWTKEKSPYIVSNDLVIAPLARLVIDPGVEVLIEKPLELPKGIEQLSSADTFAVTIRIQGALRCNGKPDNPVIFKGKEITPGDEYTHWEGIVFNSNRSNEILMNYTQISHASTAVTVTKGTPTLRGILFEKNNIGVRCAKGSSPRIAHALFTDNFFAAVRVTEANPEIYNSIFYKNRNMSIFSDRISKLTISYCDFYGNGSRDLSGCSPELRVMKKTNKNGDSTDIFGNITCDPLFVGTPGEAAALKAAVKKLTQSSIKAPSEKEIKLLQAPLKASIGKRWYLSKFSRCINAGNPSGKFKESDGTLPDLGIWGGPEVLQF